MNFASLSSSPLFFIVVGPFCGIGMSSLGPDLEGADGVSLPFLFPPAGFLALPAALASFGDCWLS